MNNSQFRNLLISNAQKKDGSAGSPPSSSSTPRPGAATPALGSRKHSSIPMTPRQVRGATSVTSEFARQLAERNGTSVDSAQKRKMRASAPKGSRLAAGYIDRTKHRVDEEEDETARRVRALEDALKLEQIDRQTFDNMVQEITGGNIATTHLVKGLDRKLLERIKRGEDVIAEKKEVEAEAEVDSDVEAEFDAVADQEIAPVVREKAEKKGEMAPPSALPVFSGKKRTRDAILAELKAARKAAEEAAAREHEMRYPSLGAGFKKIAPGSETTRIEIDAQGREVLIITDSNGKEKRKVRKQKVIEPTVEEKVEEPQLEQPAPENNLPPKEEEVDSDADDIFEGVGSAYNPLADIEDEDDDSDSDEEAVPTANTAKAPPQEDNKSEAQSSSLRESGEASEGEISESEPSESTSQPPAHAPISFKPATSTTKRNYFTTPAPSSTIVNPPSAADATVLAALAKVRTLDANSTLLANSEESRLAKRATELAHDRDAEDMDFGFGASRFDDADEMEREGEKVKFSEWRGLGEDGEDDEEGGRHEAKKRKRGPKKGKKGDKNSVADVLKVMERQKGGGKALG